ncbi:Uncharacterised protein [Segatella copri]|nr:Uncharacterised protein [Segatella copri]
MRALELELKASSVRIGQINITSVYALCIVYESKLLIIGFPTISTTDEVDEWIVINLL